MIVSNVLYVPPTITRCVVLKTSGKVERSCEVVSTQHHTLSHIVRSYQQSLGREVQLIIGVAKATEISDEYLG